MNQRGIFVTGFSWLFCQALSKRLNLEMYKPGDTTTNPRFHKLLSIFKRRTGCAVLVNTSFNVRGEPIVCTPEDAFRCFMATEMETLVVGNCFLEKADQDSALN